MSKVPLQAKLNRINPSQIKHSQAVYLTHNLSVSCFSSTWGWKPCEFKLDCEQYHMLKKTSCYTDDGSWCYDLIKTGSVLVEKVTGTFLNANKAQLIMVLLHNHNCGKIDIITIMNNTIVLIIPHIILPFHMV